MAGLTIHVKVISLIAAEAEYSVNLVLHALPYIPVKCDKFFPRRGRSCCTETVVCHYKLLTIVAPIFASTTTHARVCRITQRGTSIVNCGKEMAKLINPRPQS
jgi:hypothetical protein